MISFKFQEELYTEHSFPDIDRINSYISFMKADLAVSTELQTILVDYKLSRGKILILTALAKKEDGNLTPSEIANLLGVTRGTMTGLIQGLERDKFIQRTTHESDHRMVFVSITEEGKKILNQILPIYHILLSELLEDFTKEELENLQRYAIKLHDGLEKVKRNNFLSK